MRYDPFTRLLPRPRALFYDSRSFSLHSGNISNTLSSLTNTHHFSSHSSQNPPESFLGIGNSVISKCSHLFDRYKRNNTNINFTFADADASSLQDILKQYGHLSPETTRRFWRVSTLKPEDFLQILLGFGLNANASFLWSFFTWAAKKNGGFYCHLPMSYQIMASILIRARMLRDAELLILSLVSTHAVPGLGWMFGETIRGYAGNGQIENAMGLYELARGKGLVLSGSCYNDLLRVLIGVQKADFAVRVYMDMIEVGWSSSSGERVMEFVVGSLSKNGKVREAVNVLRTVRSVGIEPSGVALSAVVEGYCTKKDYGDVLNFLEEWKYIPEAIVCNKVVASLCRDLGIEEALLFSQRMEGLGFATDAMTFEILISYSCKERKLRNAFFYLAESFSRCVTLKVHAYNALISGVMKEGMYSCAGNIFEDMVEKGLMLEQSTFKVLLAGYCKHRKFDEVKQVLGEMTKRDLVSLAPVEDALSKAFAVLGLDHLGVKVKRDNDLGLAKTEFYDSLGNGLYLETDIEEYDKTLEVILDNGILPDFDSLIFAECYKGDIESALRVKDEALLWGMRPSLSAYSELLKSLCASPTWMNLTSFLLDEMRESVCLLGHETLNLLIKNLSKNGMTNIAKSLLGRLSERQILLETDTLTALVRGFCNEENLNGLRECLEHIQRGTWLPGSKEIELLTTFLCKFGMIKEVLKLFDWVMKHVNTDLISCMCNAIVKELCVSGFTTVGHIFLKEILQRGISIDNTPYINLLEGFLEEQKLTEALGMIDKLLEKTITPSVNVYRLMVPLLFRFDRADRAKSLKHSMLNAQFEAAILVYNTFINELCRMRKMDQAAIELQEMLLYRFFPDENTLNALIRGYCHSDNLIKSLEILCVLLRNHGDLSITGYRSLVGQFCVHGRVHGALNLRKLMQLESESVSLVLCNILLFSLFRSRNSILVAPLLKIMLEKHIIPDQDMHNILIYGYYKCGDVFRSVKLLNNMVLQGMKPSNRSLRTVIRYLCDNGELDKALKLNKVMECSGWKHGSLTLYALVEALVSDGGIHKAELLLDELAEKNMIANNISYDLLIPKLCVHGSIKKAVHLLNVMLMTGNSPSDISYSLVIKRLAVEKAFDHALDFYSEMIHQNLQPRLDSCNALIYGLCDNGRITDARIFLGQMLRFGPIPTFNMYNHVIDKFYVANNLDVASALLQEMQQAGHSPNFETHWSLISNLSTCDNKDNDTDGMGFLSRLLSGNDTSEKNCTDKCVLY